MCWNTPGRNCDACQAIFDACKCETKFTNNRGYRQCVFCSEEHEKVEQKKDSCPYCKTEYRTILECSQSCMSR